MKSVERGVLPGCPKSFGSAGVPGLGEKLGKFFGVDAVEAGHPDAPSSHADIPLAAATRALRSSDLAGGTSPRLGATDSASRTIMNLLPSNI